MPGSLNQHNVFDDWNILKLQIRVADLNEPPLYDALLHLGSPLSTFEKKSD